MQQKVLIVGSGPAGSSAAYFLSGHGFDITVAERLGNSQYGRYHQICGGGISKSAFDSLPSEVQCGVLNEFEKTKLLWPDGTEIVMKTKGYIIDRPEFLNNMKNKCGDDVKFVYSPIVSIEKTEDGFTAVSSDGNVNRYDWIIGADGAYSVVRKCLFGSKPAFSCYATEYLVCRKSDGDLTIKLSDDGSGSYMWDFPRGNMSGTGGMKGHCPDCDFITEGTRMIPVGGVGKISDGKAMLIGDAAAMANPVTYGGLKAALISGRKAAESVIKNDTEILRKWWDKSILSDRRFMDFNRRLRGWTPEDMKKAVKPFRNGHVIPSGIVACITQPGNIRMYFGCLFAFRYGW